MNKLYVLAAVFFMAACADDSDDLGYVTGTLLKEGAPDAGAPDDICSSLPASGPCSLACDYTELVRQYGHPGECIEFSCPVGSSIPSVSVCEADLPTPKQQLPHVPTRPAL